MSQIETKNPGILKVPAGKNVDDLPQSHFENLVDKIGYEKVIRALTNLEVWNKDKNKALSTWASNMADKLKKKFRPESAQKNEDVQQYVYLKDNNGKKFKDWQELLNAIKSRSKDAQRFIILLTDYAIGVSSNPATLRKYLPATRENVEKLKKKPIVEASQKNEAKTYKIGDTVKAKYENKPIKGKIVSIRDAIVPKNRRNGALKEYSIEVKNTPSLSLSYVVPDYAILESCQKSTKQLLEAANRKCEMRWKVLAFNPDEDNKLVKEFKDFDCIDCAAAKKREYLEKNPTHVVEIISESKAQRNEDVILRQGKTLQGNPWTETKVGEKTVNILGVNLKYDIVKFHVDMPEDKKTFTDKDRLEYKITNESEIDKLEKIIQTTICSKIGNADIGSTKQIGINIQGYIKG